MKTIYKSVANSLLGALLCTPLLGFAASPGVLGPTSTTSFNLNITVPPVVAIGNLTNVDMKYETNFQQIVTSPFCVSSNTPGQSYKIEISSPAANGSTFVLTNNAKVIVPGQPTPSDDFTYTLFFFNNPNGGATGGTPFVSGTKLGPFGTGTPGQGGTVGDCALLGANNASLVFNFQPSAGSGPMDVGLYQDTLSITLYDGTT